MSFTWAADMTNIQSVVVSCFAAMADMRNHLYDLHQYSIPQIYACRDIKPSQSKNILRI